MILAHKTVTNCYHTVAQVEEVASIPIGASKTKSPKKNAKIIRKISKIH